MIKKNLANIITVTRIIGTFVMIFSDIQTTSFIVAYIYSGLSDVIDGFIARKLKIESNIGRKLDSVSDLFFYTTMMIKIWPYLVEYLPTYVWAIIWITLAIRVLLYGYGLYKKHVLISNHTIFNKATGLFMFALPFLIKNGKVFKIYGIFVSLLALFAALYEIYLVSNKEK